MSAFLASTDSLFAKNVQRQHSSAAVPAPWRRHVSTGLQQRLTGTSVLEALGDDTVVTSANLRLSLFAGRGVGENQIKIKSKIKQNIKSKIKEKIKSVSLFSIVFPFLPQNDCCGPLREN